MYNLPLACMGKDVGLQIGAFVGLVEEMDVNELGIGWGEFLRVHILLDLLKPLSRGRFYNSKINPYGSPFNMRKYHLFVSNAG